MKIPLFYIFFLPFGKLLRRGRRDRMQRYSDEEAKSYWETPEDTDDTIMERQY